MRISMHPGQFTLINSPNEGVFERSKRELEYHAQVLNLMDLDSSAKIQIHVGGIYGDKDRSLTRFINRFEMLDANVKDRLVIENDDRRYTLRDCLHLNAETGVPVLFDLFHHEINCSGENLQEALKLLAATWKAKDGILMVDYSMQKAGHKIGTHADTVNSSLFKDLLVKSKPYDFDVMLEIKDKELSALEAIEIARKDDRFLAAVHTDKTLRNP